MQKHEGVVECYHQGYHGVWLEHRLQGGEEQDIPAGAGSQKVWSARPRSTGWGGEGSDGFTQKGHQNGVWKDELGVLHAPVGENIPRAGIVFSLATS